MPLNTRAGSADAPIEPGARTLWEPCVTGPRWKLWRLIVPAKPLPFETPDTLTFWPFSKTWSTFSSLPTSASPGSPRNSPRCLSVPTPAFFRCPSLGRVIEPLQRVHRLRGGLQDVDQPLVGAELEVLARILVLERTPDDAVDVLL